MLKVNAVAAIACLTVTVGSAPIMAQENLKPFEAAAKGQQRYVIMLPKKKQEANWQVEIMAGKIMDVDCNTRGLSGSVEPKTLNGWGYTYYEYVGEAHAFSTMMACPDDTTRKDFVAAPSRMVRYNSKLPVVVYVPEGMSVRYRLWTAGPSTPAVIR